MARHRLEGYVIAFSLVLLCLGGFSTSAQDAAPRIAFVSDRDGVPNVHVMEADGSNPVNLTNGVSEENQPAWSSDGQKLAFVSTLDNDGHTDLYSVGLDGAPPLQLTTGKLNASGAVWSPDGTKIVFSHGDVGAAHVYVIDADGANEHPLIPGEADSGTTSGAADWSPDGAKIAFRAFSSADRGELTVVNTDGGSPVILGSTPDVQTDPLWSPDGTKIAYLANLTGVVEVFVANADGSGVTQLTDLRTFGGLHAWSPDGTKIAFVGFNGDFTDLYVVSASGGEVVNLTQTDAAFEFSPTWSPDSSQIAFHTDRDGNNEIYVVNADGSNPVNLTNDPGEDTNPVWQPAAGSVASAQPVAVQPTAAPTRAPAPNPNAIALPDGLQTISAGNAVQLTELLAFDPDDIDAANRTGFEGALAANSDWIRALVTIGTMAGLEDAAFSLDYAIGAYPLIDRVTVDTNMAASNPFSATEDFRGEYNDLASASISPDSTLLAVGDGRGAAALWDIAAGEEIAHWQAHSDYLNTVLFTPDGSQLITVGWESDSPSIGVWNPTTGEAISKINVPGDAYSAAFNPDGSLLAVGGSTTVAFWDIASGQQVAQFDSQTDYVDRVAFSPDGSLLAAGVGDGSIYLWDVATTTRVAALKPQQPADQDYLQIMSFLSFSPDGALLLSARRDGMLFFWGTTAEPGAAPQPQPTTAAETAPTEAPAASPAPTSAPAEAPTEAPAGSAVTCALTGNSNVNLRGGPGTSFDRVGTLAAGETAQADGQTQAADGFTWYRLTTGAWVRADLVTAADCAGVTTVSP